jgi:hypothetical protein
VRSMDLTLTRIVGVNGPLAGRMQMYIERLMQSRLEATDDASRKRGLPNEEESPVSSVKVNSRSKLAGPGAIGGILSIGGGKALSCRR